MSSSVLALVPSRSLAFGITLSSSSSTGMELELKNAYLELYAILIFTRTAEMKLQATYFHFFAELALMLGTMCKFKRNEHQEAGNKSQNSVKIKWDELFQCI